jgi:hypothetical protein
MTSLEEEPILNCDNCNTEIYENEGMISVDGASYVYCDSNKCLLNKKQSKKHGIYGFTLDADYDSGYFYRTTAQKGDER